jgi:hypothetical protein
MLAPQLPTRLYCANGTEVETTYGEFDRGELLGKLPIGDLPGRSVSHGGRRILALEVPV